MSYASIAARDAPLPSKQPHPNPALLTTERSPSNNAIDDTSKVNVISRDEDPSTYTSDVYIPEDTEDELIQGTGRKVEKGKRTERLQQVQAEGSYLWEVTKHYLFRPGVASGLVGLLNIGLLSGVGYAFYTKPGLRRNFTAIGSAVVGTLLLIGTEGCAAEKFREMKFHRGHQGERPTREGMLFYKHFRQQIFRPGVLGGSVGLAILGAVGYYSYANWDRPKWNRDVVTAVSLGLLMLWGSEGYLEQYHSEQRRH